MKYILFFAALSIIGCSPSWRDGPYEVYWIDGTKNLGFNVGESSYIQRIEEPKEISSNNNFISVYACPEKSCAFYYIDRVKDHKFAEPKEFVFGPYTKQEFEQLQKEMSLPKVGES